MPPGRGSSYVETLTGANAQPTQPLLVAWPPSPLLLINYPLFAANVRVLCDKDSWRSRSSSSLATAVISIRDTYKGEGLVGVYRGGHIYLLHQAIRDVLKLLAERGIRIMERRWEPMDGDDKVTESAPLIPIQERKMGVWGFRCRLAAKYLIEVACYPLLLVSTRLCIVHADPRNSWQHVVNWAKEEGVLSLYGGVCASLISTALEEAMEWVLAWCIDYCARDSEMELSDKLLIRASGSCVVANFTAPVGYLGVIRRCQSRLPYMLEHEPIGKSIRTLPWVGTMYNFALYGGIMALNVRLIQLKIQLQNEMD